MNCVIAGSSRSTGLYLQPFYCNVDADFFIGVENVAMTCLLRLFCCGSMTPGKAGKLYRSVMRSALEAEP